MRGINKWLWPHMAIAMHNELAERSHACAFLVNFVFENAPGRRPEDVLVVSGDGFFTQANIEEMGFPSARLQRDWHHLFESLEDLFGKEAHCVISGELSLMIRASSEDFFNKALDNARTLFCGS